jgi:carbon monoxide dehydrogenase subunit G
MDNLSEFESRTGRLEFSGETVWNFVTDIRNFERFIPAGSVGDIKIANDSCSIQVSMLGTVNIRISEKTAYDKVVFSGNALGQNNFLLILNINSTGQNKSDVKVKLTAELNPMLKMLASDPLQKFLETLISEMEKFTGWDKTI